MIGIDASEIRKIDDPLARIREADVAILRANELVQELSTMRDTAIRELLEVRTLEEIAELLGVDQASLHHVMASYKPSLGGHDSRSQRELDAAVDRWGVCWQCCHPLDVDESTHQVFCHMDRNHQAQRPELRNMSQLTTVILDEDKREFPLYLDAQGIRWVFIPDEDWRADPRLGAWTSAPGRRQDAGAYIPYFHWSEFVDENGNLR